MDLTLFGFLKNWNERQENVIAYIIREITRGISYIHSNFNIHRDLKSENIFLNQEGSVKIGDFGLSAQLIQERDYRETFAGSPLWTAPEILNGERYKESVDIWSLGVICYECAEGTTPYGDSKNMLDLKKNIEKHPEPTISQHWSPQFQQFVVFCLQKDPKNRKNAHELLETEFLRNVDETCSRRRLIELISSSIVL
jgi:serine/threonine-protein kinase 24/25/MST4